MPLTKFPVEIIMCVVNFVPLAPPSHLAGLMLVNKVFLKLAEERLYRDLDMTLLWRKQAAIECLETLKKHKSAAEAVRHIGVSWAIPVEEVLQNLFADSLEHTTSLSTLSLSNSGFFEAHTEVNTYPPLFPKTLPPNFLPKLSAIGADTLDTLIQLVPHRPVDTVRLHESIDFDSIHRLRDVLRSSTSQIRHLQIKTTIPNKEHILPAFSRIISEEKFQDLVILGLEFHLAPLKTLEWGFFENLFDKMASDLDQFQGLRVFSFMAQLYPPPKARPSHEGVRDNIARKLPHLERIEIQWDGWEKDPVTKEWKPVRELLRLNWVLSKKITTRV